MKEKRVCENPDCRMLFLPKVPNQKYHDMDCQRHMLLIAGQKRKASEREKKKVRVAPGIDAINDDLKDFGDGISYGKARGKQYAKAREAKLHRSNKDEYTKLD